MALENSVPSTETTMTAEFCDAAQTWLDFFDNNPLPVIQAVLAKVKNYSRPSMILLTGVLLCGVLCVFIACNLLAVVMRAAAADSNWFQVLERLFDPLGLDFSRPATELPWSIKYVVQEAFVRLDKEEENWDEAKDASQRVLKKFVDADMYACRMVF